MVTRYFCPEKFIYTVVTRVVTCMVTRGDNFPGCGDGIC